MRLAFEPIEGGTRLTRTSAVEPGRLFRIALPVLWPLLTSDQNTEVANIKRQIQAGA